MELAELLGEDAPGPDHTPDPEDLGFATRALREQALDRHTAEMMVGTHQDGGHVLITHPVSLQQAHVWLLDALYEKAEAWMQADPLTAAERAASAWWFSRWRTDRPLAGDEFARGVREQEFSLVERPLVGEGLSPMRLLVEEELLGGVGPRQLHMARQLGSSVVGVWNVESRSGARTELASALDGQRYEVREHASEADNAYKKGFVLAGRLIPFGDGTWLRSPGAFLVSYGERSGQVARAMAEALEERRELMPPEPLLEATIHSLYGTRGLPRVVPPAGSPDQAAEAARTLTLLLRATGIARPVERSASRLPDLPGTEVLEYDVDVVLGEYMHALMQTSRTSRLVRDAKRRQEQAGRKHKRKRR